MKLPILFYLCFASFAAHCAPSPFSKYGNIQNIQNYSSNPYWNPNSYSQRMPTAVYATGVDITPSECQQIVSILVSEKCASANNCATTQLSDIRPTIMLQLSRIPNGNYATACSGYIEPAYQEYIKTKSIAAPTAGAAFPTTNFAPNASYKTDEFKIQNPYLPPVPDWAEQMQDRKQELLDLQAENGSGPVDLVRKAFPTTSADMNAQQRHALAAQGYEPYKDNRAFQEITLEDAETYLSRQQSLANLRNSATNATGGATNQNNANDSRLSRNEKNNLIERIMAVFPK